MILVAGGVKGGSGKTTLAVNLAVIRSAKDRDVLLVDADDQGSARDFTEIREEEQGDAGYTCVRLDGKAVRSQIQRLEDKYDDIIVDTGGRDTTSQRAALTVADLLVAPFGPRSLDLWTLEEVEKLVSDARAVNSDLKACSFINRADHQGSYNEETREVLADSEEVDFISATLGDRKVFGIAFDHGESVLEYTPRNKKAIREMVDLYNGLLDFLPS